MFDQVTALGFEELKATFEATEFFEDKTWQLSPYALELDPKAVEEMKAIGQAGLEFHRALEQLYLRSVSGKNLLRNRKLEAPWVAELYDRGKPQELIDCNRSEMLRGKMPLVLRPDLLVTDEGFALTEFDSVPGGIGLTAFLNRIYGKVDDQVIGGKDEMLDVFANTIAPKDSSGRRPLVAIVVSDDAATYRPEMEWLAEELQKKGTRILCLHPDELIPLGGGIFYDSDGTPEKIDVIYRFFELYELEGLATANDLLEAVKNEEVEITPPLRSIFEEKLSMALFHHHLLEDYWRESLSRRALRVLEKLIPRSWILDPQPLPPGAVHVGPKVGGKLMHDWRELFEASQRERDLIIKISGFDSTAEGARSVLYGRDSSREEWQEGIEAAIEHSKTHPYVVQEYRKPIRSKHVVYDENGEAKERFGRLRLCPYYFFQGDQAELTGVLATFCPADKKIIHGMTDAAMLPCRIASAE